MRLTIRKLKSIIRESIQEVGYNKDMNKQIVEDEEGSFIFQGKSPSFVVAHTFEDGVPNETFCFSSKKDALRKYEQMVSNLEEVDTSEVVWLLGPFTTGEVVFDNFDDGADKAAEGMCKIIRDSWSDSN